MREGAELCAFAHDRGLFVHVDGARIANAAAALGVSLRALTAGAGVDVLSFGGTKNGLMLGEAICFFTQSHAGAAPYVVKQAMQLASKARYLGAQFERLLTGDRWLRYASHANAMAERLPIGCAHRRRARDAPRSLQRGLRDAGGAIERIQREFFFYVLRSALPEVRWMTHWATTPPTLTLRRRPRTLCCDRLAERTQRRAA